MSFTKMILSEICEPQVHIKGSIRHRYIIENFEIRPGFNNALLNKSCIAMCMQLIQLPVMCCLQNFQLYGFKLPNAGLVFDYLCQLAQVVNGHIHHQQHLADSWGTLNLDGVALLSAADNLRILCGVLLT